MKLNLFLISILSLLFIKCSSQNKENKSQKIIKSRDTILVKKINKLENYDTHTLKSFSYLWITKKDTLDFKIHANEYLIDSAKTHIHIQITHSETIFFSNALEYLKKAITIIQKDFTLKSLGSLQFEGPYAYKDFSTILPKEYESKYGKKKINYLELNHFLNESSLNIELKKFLFSLKKDTYEYSIEKFQVRESIITGIAILVRIKNDE